MLRGQQWEGVREGNGSPLQYSCLENPTRGAWWAAVHGVTQSRTQLKRLSMPECIGEGNGNPLQYSCLENPRDRGVWWAAVYGIAQSRTRLKRLSSNGKEYPDLSPVPFSSLLQELSIGQSQLDIRGLESLEPSPGHRDRVGRALEWVPVVG